MLISMSDSKHEYTKLDSKSILICNTGSSNLEVELIEFTTNKELKIKFKSGYQEFWLQKSILTLYPGLLEIVQKFLIAFPSSYLAKREFSAVTNLLSKKTNRLHITEHDDLRIVFNEN